MSQQMGKQMVYAGLVKAGPAGNRALTPNLTASGNEAGMYLTHLRAGCHSVFEGA